MSLLEDVFLEDEAGEALELERVIEGDEFDDRPRSAASNSDANSEKEDEAVEDKTRVDPTKPKNIRVVKNPRVILNPARLTGPRGIQVIPDHFKDLKFKGKGHEKEDLDLVLKKLEHWAYRLFPKFEFGDCLKKIETLGKKRPVMVHLHKIRSDQYTTEETVVQKDSSDDDAPADQPQEEDEFDKLLQQQIELARATPAPSSVTKRGFETPIVEKRSPFTMPKATSSPSISDEQRDRMIRNRQLAEERRLARLKQNTITNSSTTTVDLTNTDAINDVEVIVRKHNRSNIIDSSDDEDSNAVNQPVTVDVQMHVTAVEDMTKVNDKSADTNIIDREQLNGDKTVKNITNKSNVIDSSDDEDSSASNQPVTVDVQMHDTGSEDVTKVNNDTEDKNTNPFKGKDLNGDKTAKKHNGSNVIDSLDDEDSNAVNQSVFADVQMHKTVVEDITEVNNEISDKSINVTSGEELKDNDTVDLTKEISVKHSNLFKEGQVIDIGNEDSGDIIIRKENESKVVDSSDDECEMTSFNQSDDYDVHSKNENHTSNVEKGKIRESKNEKISCDHETEVMDKDFEEIQNETTENDSKIKNINVTTKEILEAATVLDQNDNNAVETVTNVKNASNLISEVARANKENVEINVHNIANDPVEDLMDVDLSDDF